MSAKKKTKEEKASKGEPAYFDYQPEYDDHWFCHTCHAHFTLPRVEGRTSLMVCPKCTESEIELFKSRDK